MFTAFAFTSFVFMAALSVVSYKLARGTEKEKGQYERLLMPVLVVAWGSTLGSPLCQVVRDWLIGR